ncbi:MAG: XdhC family protein [Desulfobulbus sp.]|jgi:xanthine dehydrogenase accessory factor|uniref:XdhC family aldehyde oxidoreductase maturation factor n=1 Tax=Desulfobulbus sp. TaxID=895 RepID=UPI0028517265|nr:XdhC family protein [Desulfobulbus sp.]MDR2549052.1 XdhC family protein [Desulfobulbus sp.]
MKKLLQQICTSLGDGEDLVLVTIASQSGSTPRLAGAKMIVLRDGRISGTVGGGLVEATAIREAAACFAGGRSLRRTFDLDNSDVATSDMICGGRVELFLEYIEAGVANREIFGALLAAMRAGRRATLVCPLGGRAGGGQRFAVDHRGASSRADIPESLLAAIKQALAPAPATALIEHQGQRYLLSSFTVSGTVYLLGAGHVAACTAEVAARVGFRVAVMDDRGEFANRERFPLADEIRVLPSFIGCFDGLELDRDAYLVIVTRGHLHDLEVLGQALRTGAGYIGMIGSRRKRNAIYAKLMDQGVSEAQLEQVRCPIGTAIEADTPEEIAVSIVGELIYQRATGRRAWHLA